MGQLEPLNVKNIDRPHHGVHHVLITEILIEFTVAALIIMGAGTEIDASFHVMQAGLFPGRQIAQSIFPVYDLAAFTPGYVTLLVQPTVFSGRAPQGPVKSASLAMIINLAIFVAHNPGLHPDAGGAALGGILNFSIGFHFSKPI